MRIRRLIPLLAVLAVCACAKNPRPQLVPPAPPEVITTPTAVLEPCPPAPVTPPADVRLKAYLLGERAAGRVPDIDRALELAHADVRELWREVLELRKVILTLYVPAAPP